MAVLIAHMICATGITLCNLKLVILLLNVQVCGSNLIFFFKVTLF